MQKLVIFQGHSFFHLLALHCKYTDKHKKKSSFFSQNDLAKIQSWTKIAIKNFQTRKISVDIMEKDVREEQNFVNAISLVFLKKATIKEDRCGKDFSQKGERVHFTHFQFHFCYNLSSQKVVENDSK